MNRVTFLALVFCVAGASQPVAADSLRDIYELSLANDAQLKAEEAQYLAAIEIEKLRRSALLPQINASYDYQDVDQESIAPSVNIDPATGNFIIVDAFTNLKTQQRTYSVNLAQPLFDLPAWFSFRAGKSLSKEAEATFAANQQALILRVVEGYLEALRAQDNLDASRAAERAFERQLEQAQQRFEVGLVAITEVYEAQAARDLAQANRILEENNVAVAIEQLSVLTGQSHANLRRLAKDFQATMPQPADQAAWVDFALKHNFQLQAARYAEEAAEQLAQANKMEHLPRIVGNAGYIDARTRGRLQRDPPLVFDVPPDRDQDQFAFGVRVDMPLFTGGAVSSNRRRAAQEFVSARETRINVGRTVVTNARSLFMTVATEVARVKARAQAVVSSRAAVDATQAGYEVGTRNIVDVLNAQNTLFAAERDYANARYDYVLSLLRLKEQSGQLNPQDVYQLDAIMEDAPPVTASGESGTG